MFSKKARKIDTIFTVNLTVCSNRQIDGEDFINFCGLLEIYETNPCFLQNFQSDPTVCLIIHVFCKGYEREIVFVLIYRSGRTISGLQLLQNTEKNLWKIWISLVFI